MSRPGDGDKKTIKVYESTHARIESERREGESFADAAERLLEDDGLEDMYGVLGGEDTDTMRDAIEESHSADAESVDEIRERVRGGE